MYNDGEPSITQAIAPLVAAGALDAEVVAGLLAKAKVKLRGPDLNTEADIDIMADGSFSTGANLMAGSYQVELPVNDDDVAAGLAAAGVAFVGESAVVTVDAGGTATVNFPFRITMQTVATGARMGGGGNYGAPVAGVKLALYARADGTDMLGEATTDEMGAASFTFARADNTGPAGNDNIVFVKVMASGHDALAVSGNEFVEIAYASTARLYAADAEKEAATLVNVAVAFDFWVKSNETARDGDMGLGGWNTMVYMGEVTEDSEPLMDATMPTDDGEDNMADLGKSSFAYMVDPTMLPAMFTVMAGEDDQPDMGEAWAQADALTFTHTGLELPPEETPDLGPIRVTFTTQSLTVGVHRELDDRIGFTRYRGVGGGDARPDGQGVGKVEVRLLMENAAGRPRPYLYDHDMDPATPDVEAEAEVDKTGVATFAHVPAGDDIIVEVDAGSGVITVPTDRDAREINAYGDGLDEMGGTVVGAFGAASGARPDVWLCPLGDSADNCSTFAYKWNDGTITGTVGGLKRGDTNVVVSLVPVSSPYADDLEDDVKVAWNSTRYTFNNVADGSYRVRLEAVAGKWDADSTAVIDVVHNQNPRGDDTGAVTINANAEEYGGLSATSLRSGIRGTIGNDASGNGSLSRSEAISGVEVALYDAVEITDPDSDDVGKYKVGAAIEDDDGPITTTTDSDGVYTFTKLVDGKNYFVKAMSADNYSVVRNRGEDEVGDEGEVISMALATAAAITAPYTASTPTWNYYTSTAGDVAAADFVLLYKDGAAEGEATDPSARAKHSDTSIELQRCLTTEDAVNRCDGH